jgi:hypothetical protein
LVQPQEWHIVHEEPGKAEKQKPAPRAKKGKSK